MIDQGSPKKHILLVDDEKSLTQTLSMLLETRGYAVQVANSAEEAYQKISPYFDLIILDLILPDVHGFEVCRKIRGDENTRHIPIIILSAYSIYENKVQGLYLGADDFLTKPCEHEELFARIDVILRRYQGGGEGETGKGSQDFLIFELRKILDEALIVPYIQPVYVFHPFGLLGVEVLSRPKTDGLLADPESFFKVALQYGMYVDLEMLAWTLALRALRSVVKNEKIFLNCNPYFIESSQFLRVKALVEKNRLPPDGIVLEITERNAISDYKLFYEQLEFYRDYGFHVAVDDVGGGYASLQAIVETRPEFVKIDRHFVKALRNDRFKRSVVKFVASLCRENRIVSIAEGIETQEDFDVVRDMGVDAGQGFYFFHPTACLNMEQFAPRRFASQSEAKRDAGVSLR